MKEYPIYTAVAVAADGTKYYLDNAVLDLTIDEAKNELADKVSLSLRNAKTETGKYLSGCLDLDTVLFVKANDGKKTEEVFRGPFWDITYQSKEDKELKVTAYTNLIYLEKSKDCLYFSAGKYTDVIVRSICKKWNIALNYVYDKIKHPKLPFNNKTIADIIIELLDEVKKKKGTKYVIRGVKDSIQIRKVATNTDVYHFQKQKSALSTKSNITKDGLITKVVIYGKEDDNERRAVQATVNGSYLKKYGTLQDVVTMSSNTTLAEAKKEANEILKENGTPKKTYDIETLDVPWVHKGDLIRITAGDMSGKFIVLSVSHDALKKTMSMEVEKYG